MNTPSRTFGSAAASDNAFDGVLLIDKPIGPTSHDIVDRVRKFFKIKKVGHGGTLDPMASGLLILLLGKGTKLSDRFLGSDKVYQGTMHFGMATDSQDAMGDVIKEADASMLDADCIREQMRARIGDSMQMPPMVSALKVNGIPLYKHARKGKTVERKARLIHVFRFDLLAFDPPCADFEVKCTKGTYVRTLCADIGESLGCGAHLSKLRRTQCGSLSVEKAIPLAEALQMNATELASHVMPMRLFA